MTTVYLVRHAEPNYRNHDDATRELSPKGLADRGLVTAYLLDKGVQAVLSSPYRRAVDTVRPLADALRLPVEHVSDFRERRVDRVWIENFDTFCRQQWADFDYRLEGGECLREVQERTAAAFSRVLRDHAGQCVVIGGHGTAFSLLLNHIDPSFGHDQFHELRRVMPWIIRLDFSGDVYLGRKYIALQ